MEKDDNKGMKSGGFTRKTYRIFSTLVASYVVLFLFQNCGSDGAQQQGLFPTTLYSNNRCLSEVVDCGPNAGYLQITLDMVDNQVFPAASTSMTVSGRCNTGNYTDSYIYWILIDPNANTIASGNEFDTCIKGKYQFPVSLIGLALNTNYTVVLKMIGRGEDGIDYENNMNNGSAQLDFSKQ